MNTAELFEQLAMDHLTPLEMIGQLVECLTAEIGDEIDEESTYHLAVNLTFNRPHTPQALAKAIRLYLDEQDVELYDDEAEFGDDFSETPFDDDI